MIKKYVWSWKCAKCGVESFVVSETGVCKNRFTCSQRQMVNREIRGSIINNQSRRLL